MSTSRAGLFSADVLPGESIDLTFAITHSVETSELIVSLWISGLMNNSAHSLGRLGTLGTGVDLP